jgi:penicillin-binding protein 1C
MQRELILLEDKNFWTHVGLDTSAILASVKSWIETGKPRGASTITMQVVNLLHPDLRKLRFYKYHQAREAMALEEEWTKEQILEVYLNKATLKGEIKGFPAAARVFYGKSHQQLFFSERLWLYSLLPSPNASWETLERRACAYGKKISLSYNCLELQAQMTVFVQTSKL